MRTKGSDKWQVTGDKQAAAAFSHTSRLASAFTLIEVVVAMAILILIVTALMTVFSNTQAAFRASVTQSDILENGRATMELMAADLSAITPSDCPSNGYINLYYSNVNFYISPVNNFSIPQSPLIQPLVGASPGQNRTNLLENFFFLARDTFNGGNTWIGTGYAVNTNSANGALYPLYRFNQTENIAFGGTPESLFTNFIALQFTNSAVWSHLMDGVVGLTIRAYDTNGYWITGPTNYDGSTNGYPNDNTLFFGSSPAANWGETCLMMFSNAVPASVQVELDALEDRSLQRAESLSGSAQTNYLANNTVAKVHVFRQRISIPLVDPSANQ